MQALHCKLHMCPDLREWLGYWYSKLASALASCFWWVEVPTQCKQARPKPVQSSAEVSEVAYRTLDRAITANLHGQGSVVLGSVIGIPRSLYDCSLWQLKT